MNEGSDYSWENMKQMPASGDFTCGYCGARVSSNRGFEGWRNLGGRIIERIYFCHSCGKPTFFDFDHKQYPGPLLPPVPGITSDLVNGMYEEARRAMSAGAYSAAIMCCRTLLAHIAVEEGADKGKKFVEYVDYLDANGFIPKRGKSWVTEIKNKGNSAVHDIVLYGEPDAQQIMKFTEFLLKSNYEYPSYIPDEEGGETAA